MIMLDMSEFLALAGMPMPTRDMSAYNGRDFECACGQRHAFYAYMDYRNFPSTGAKAKMMVSCPNDPAYATLIETKLKFMVKFEKFISLAGCKV